MALTVLPNHYVANTSTYTLSTPQFFQTDFIAQQAVYFGAIQPLLSSSEGCYEACQDVYSYCMEHCQGMEPDSEFNICSINCHLAQEACIVECSKENLVQEFVLSADIFKLRPVS